MRDFDFEVTRSDSCRFDVSAVFCRLLADPARRPGGRGWARLEILAQRHPRASWFFHGRGVLPGTGGGFKARGIRRAPWGSRGGGPADCVPRRATNAHAPTCVRQRLRRRATKTHATCVRRRLRRATTFWRGRRGGGEDQSLPRFLLYPRCFPISMPIWLAVNLFPIRSDSTSPISADFDVSSDFCRLDVRDDPI